jgi:hypothetical protein
LKENYMQHILKMREYYTNMMTICGSYLVRATTKILKF